MAATFAIAEYASRAKAAAFTAAEFVSVCKDGGWRSIATTRAKAP